MSRRSRPETKQALLDAGMAQLDREGLQVGTQHVRLPAIAADLEMSAGAAYYAFPDGQEEFQRELWAEMARRVSRRAPAEVFAAATQLVSIGVDLDEFVRALGTDHANLEGDEFWSVILAIASAGRNSRADEARRIVEEDLNRGHKAVAEAYEKLLLMFDLEMLAPLAVEDLVSAIACLGDGFRFRMTYQSVLVDKVVLRPNVNGELKPWSLFAIAVQALLTNMTRTRRDVAKESDVALIERSAKVTTVASSVEDDLALAEDRLREARLRLRRARLGE